MGRAPPPRRFDELPDWCEIPIGKRTSELCLFWQRSEGDALAILAGLALMKGCATVKHVKAACAILEARTDDGARRLAHRLRRATITTVDNVPWYVNQLPPTVERREQHYANGDVASRACAYIIIPGHQCGNHGMFKVKGAHGSYCPVHARMTAARVARNAERKAQRRAKYAAQKKAEPPAP